MLKKGILPLLLFINSSIIFAIAPNLIWHDCSKNMNGTPCYYTHVIVPRNYKKPNAGTFTLKVLKVPAANKSKKEGTLFINFGMPWESQDETFYQFPSFNHKLFSALHNYFDLVTFTIRGSDMNVSCQTNTAKKLRGKMLKLNLNDPKQLKTYIRLQHQLFIACKAYHDKTLWHLGTKNSVRDLQRVRQALGIPKINYYGDSYGTILGQQYLINYHDNVRAMILDGNMNPDYDMRAWILHAAAANEDTLHLFFNLCTKAGSKCALYPNPQKKFAATIGILTKNSIAGRGEFARQKLTRGMFNNLLESLMPFPEMPVSLPGSHLNSWQYLAKGINDIYTKNDASRLLNLFNQMMSYHPDTGLVDTKDDWLSTAIFALDFNNQPNDKKLRNDAYKLNKLYPLAGVVATQFEAASFGWPIPANPLTRLPKTTRFPAALIVGNLHDPTTSYSDSKEVAQRLTNSRLLTWQGVGHTAIYNTQSDCIINHELDYLRYLKLPAKGTSCPYTLNPFVETHTRGLKPSATET